MSNHHDLPTRPAVVVDSTLAISADDVARLLGVSKRHVYALHASGRLPRPIRLGRATRWNLRELVAWLDAGAPSRDRWEATRQDGQR